MKTIYTILVCMLFQTNSFAQVTEIYVPTDYGVSYGNWSFGGSTPFYQKDGYIYCISRKQSVSEGKIFKINQTTNEVTPIQEDTSIVNYDYNDKPIYIGEYGDKIIFVDKNMQVSSVLNTTTNTFTPSYFYGGSTPALYNGYLYSGTQKKNLDTGVVSPIGSYLNSNNIAITLNFYYLTVIGNDLYGFQYESVAGLLSSIINKIFKITNNTAPALIYDSIDKSIHPVGNTNLSKVNGKLIFTESNTPNNDFKLISISENGGSRTEIQSPTNAAYSQLIYNNQLYFSDVNGQNMQKTDGTSVSASGLSFVHNYGGYVFSSKYLPFANFVEYNGEMYSCRYGVNSGIARYFIKFNGTSETLLHQFLDMRAACGINNKLYFSARYFNENNQDVYGIFSFDGSSIYKLDLGGIPATFTSQSIFPFNNYLFFGNSNTLIKIDLDAVESDFFSSTLGVNNTSGKSHFKLYPNPVQSNLYFSEELSEIKLKDMSGKIVSQHQLKTKNISVENLPKGNYIITGRNSTGETVSEKIIKN